MVDIAGSEYTTVMVRESLVGQEMSGVEVRRIEVDVLMVVEVFVDGKVVGEERRKSRRRDFGMDGT